MLTQSIFSEARNDWERKEQALIANLHNYILKDPDSIDAFCKLIFFYREEIAHRVLLVKDLEVKNG